MDNFEILGAGIIPKYHVQDLLLFVYIRSQVIFVTHKRPLFC